MQERKNLINSFLIPVDKANHFIVGTVAYVLFSIIFSPIIAIILVTLIGLGKEVYDHKSKTGNADPIDLLFTVLGAIPPMILDLIK